MRKPLLVVVLSVAVLVKTPHLPFWAVGGFSVIAAFAVVVLIFDLVEYFTNPK